jgi:chemotaxis protein MotB
MAEDLEEDDAPEEECPKCPPVGAPAWMATFADMATLLMAFFRDDFVFRRDECSKI